MQASFRHGRIKFEGVHRVRYVMVLLNDIERLAI
jgi:hypothetical protein